MDDLESRLKDHCRRFLFGGRLVRIAGHSDVAVLMRDDFKLDCSEETVCLVVRANARQIVVQTVPIESIRPARRGDHVSDRILNEAWYQSDLMRERLGDCEFRNLAA